MLHEEHYQGLCKINTGNEAKKIVALQLTAVKLGME